MRTSRDPHALVQARGLVVAHLRQRRSAIGEALQARMYAIGDPSEPIDPLYLQGLKSSLTAALDYGLESVELGNEHAPPIPVPLLAQARVAARSGVRLDTVLRRYFAGYNLFGEFLLDAAAETGVGGEMLKAMARGQAGLFDRLMAAISDEYEREAIEDSRWTTTRRRLQQVKGLLRGELLEAPDLGYDFDAEHLGLIATGPATVEKLRAVAERFGLRLLVVKPEDAVAWVWFGGDPEDVDALHAAHWSRNEGVVSVGAPGRGLEGWRLTHRQAAAALPVAQRSRDGVARYAGAALLAASMRDGVLADSLHHLYLRPLLTGPNGGRVLLETLRAYFEAERNVSSTAAALGVNRRTINRRIRTAEEVIGRRLHQVAGELEAALQLDLVEQGCTNGDFAIDQSAQTATDPMVARLRG